MNKLLSCRYNTDTNRVEARFKDGTTLAIDCIAVEDEYGNTPAQRTELDWLLYNKPLEYAPVSYTHLDVYKRQSFCRMANSSAPKRCIRLRAFFSASEKS